MFYQGHQFLVKLKRDLTYKGYVYFQPVLPHIIYQVLAYLEWHNKFFGDISIAKYLSSQDMSRFSDIGEPQEEKQSVTEKNFQMKKKWVKIWYNAEIDYTSVENPLNIHRSAWNETILVSKILNIINEENVIIPPGQGQKPVLILSDE